MNKHMYYSTIYYSTIYQSPAGDLTLASDGGNLVGLWLEGQKYHGGAIARQMAAKGGMPAKNGVLAKNEKTQNAPPVLDAARRWLDRYFAGEKPAAAELPLAPVGAGEFRQSVWKILCGIPYGKTTTYGEIAKKLAVKMGRKTMSAQAVGGAVGHNPISIIIPCHRVVGAGGSLTGYAGGITIKKKLLELEGIDLSRLFVPKKGTAL
jgi:methylated-DNA-[protein]-cysteine S-methyltransferase